jgi:hypothetical protein
VLARFPIGPFSTSLSFTAPCVRRSPARSALERGSSWKRAPTSPFETSTHSWPMEVGLRRNLVGGWCVRARFEEPRRSGVCALEEISRYRSFGWR